MRPSHRKRNRDWPRRRHARGVTTINAMHILKELWPAPGPEVARPWPYKLAYKRNWISAATYYAVKPEPTGRPGPLDFMYRDYPLLGLIKKTQPGTKAMTT